MILTILKIIDGVASPKPIYAHCDIPCGIYDPHNAQMAAHTVIRMTKMLKDLNEPDDNKADHQIARLTKVKEEHAELAKREVVILWGDYFKLEHLEKFPTLHDLIFKTLKLASKTKQEINLDAANELLENTHKIAEIFYQTKDKEPVKIKTVYPTGGEIVSYK